MGTAKGMIERASRDLGLSGRPNRITVDYAARQGAAFLRAPWCNMATTEWARGSGNFDKGANWGTDYAYTVWNAQEGQRRGRWVYGVQGIRSGDVVFFDWQSGRSIGGIDHVGIVEKVLTGGRIQTIEGNTNDVCARRVRGGAVITGYIRPEYDDVSAPITGGTGGYQGYEPYNRTARPGERILRQYSRGDDVKAVQKSVGADDDGAFGPLTTAAVKRYQSAQGLDNDGVVGPLTWAKILGKAPAKPTVEPFPLPAGHWFGTPSADQRNHSGYHWVGDRPGIKKIQKKVGVKDDGRYGALTAAAVRRFQARNGLKEDALTGAKTWKKMFG